MYGELDTSRQTINSDGAVGTLGARVKATTHRSGDRALRQRAAHLRRPADRRIPERKLGPARAVRPSSRRHQRSPPPASREYGPIGDAWNDGTLPPLRAGGGYAFDLPTRRACEDFNYWRPGAVELTATVFCNPATMVAPPRGEAASFVAQAFENATLIPRTGAIPVLLAQADHDGIMPADAAALELSAWQERCGCDVSQLILRDTGHAFMGTTRSRASPPQLSAGCAATTSAEPVPLPTSGITSRP